MKIREYIESVQNDKSQRLLVNTETGQVWGVDEGALRDRGYPDGGWVLLEDVDKTDLIELIYKYLGIDSIGNGY